MKTSKTSLKGVFIIEPDVFGDERGFFGMGIELIVLLLLMTYHQVVALPGFRLGQLPEKLDS
jgi:hypothetical protein